MGMVVWLCTEYIWDPTSQDRSTRVGAMSRSEEMLKGDGHLAAGAIGASLSGISLDWQGRSH